MRNFITLVLALSFCAAAAHAQRRETPPTKEELAEITARGRMLAEYDVAAWHASDAVMALSPPEGSVERFLARKTDKGWTVAFGRFNDKRDKFLVPYEAVQGAKPTEFKVTKHDPPKEFEDFYLFAARAAETAIKDFKGEARPYNVAVLPASAGRMYVYVVPAQTKHGVYPHGGDVRYLVSADGSSIIERRQMHRSILEFEIAPATEGGFHTAVMDNVPEDTDVFYVLSRKPSAPEFIMTEKFFYKVNVDGTIQYVMTREAFLKMPKGRQ